MISDLEDMLKSTTKSIARNVVNTLIPSDKDGVLLQIEKKKSMIKTKEELDDNKNAEAKELSTEIQKVIIESKPSTKLDNNDPYKLSGITSTSKTSVSNVKLPPASSKGFKKQATRNISSNSTKNNNKARSSSSKPSSKGL